MPEADESGSPAAEQTSVPGRLAQSASRLGKRIARSPSVHDAPDEAGPAASLAEDSAPDGDADAGGRDPGLLASARAASAGAARRTTERLGSTPTSAEVPDRDAHEPEAPDPEARRLRLKHLAEAGIGAAAVVGALAIVGALVVAFGLQTANDGGPELEVAGQAPSEGPIASKLDISRNVGNLEITLLRVERLTRGGRIYLRAHNRAESAVAIPDTEVTVRQRESSAARAAPNRGGRLPRFGASIAPGERAFSVLYFPRLRQGGAVVNVQWFSRSTELLSEPVQFSFQVQ